MSLLIALALWYFVLPSPWGAIVVALAAVLEVGEIAWGLKLARRRALVGAPTLVGKHGHAVGELDPRGQVLLEGERWTARSVAGPIPAGAEVEVRGLDGIVLEVGPVA